MLLSHEAFWEEQQHITKYKKQTALPPALFLLEGFNSKIARCVNENYSFSYILESTEYRTAFRLRVLLADFVNPLTDTASAKSSCAK